MPARRRLCCLRDGAIGSCWSTGRHSRAIPSRRTSFGRRSRRASKRRGLLECVLATNCPLMRAIGLDRGEFQLTGELPPFDGVRRCWIRSAGCRRRGRCRSERGVCGNWAGFVSRSSDRNLRSPKGWGRDRGTGADRDRRRWAQFAGGQGGWRRRMQCSAGADLRVLRILARCHPTCAGDPHARATRGDQLSDQ